MSLGRALLLSVLPLVVIVGHLAVLVLDVEFWPFSPYPMYSEVRDAWRGETVQVIGLTADGAEVTLNQNGYFGPYSNLWVMNLVDELAVRGRDEQPALAALLEVYDARRAAGAHDGPALLGFRVERVGYALVREQTAPPIDERAVIATYRRGGRP